MKGRAGEGKVTIETVRRRSEFTQVNGAFFKSISLRLCALWFRRGSFHCRLSTYEPCERVAYDGLSCQTGKKPGAQPLTLEKRGKKTLTYGLKMKFEHFEMNDRARRNTREMQRFDRKELHNVTANT